jgi:transcriptional antiterminator Rof (Rho-off)
MDVFTELDKENNDYENELHYRSRLEKAFGAYSFINSCHLKSKLLENGQYHISLKLHLKKGKVLFSEALRMKENRALFKTIKKMQIQVEKRKEVVYDSNNKIKIK